MINDHDFVATLFKIFASGDVFVLESENIRRARLCCYPMLYVTLAVTLFATPTMTLLIILLLPYCCSVLYIGVTLF